MLKRRQMCAAECAKILRRYNEMRLTSNDQRRRPSPTPKYRGSGLNHKLIVISAYAPTLEVREANPELRELFYNQLDSTVSRDS